MQLSPSEYVIHSFGGVRATAKALGKTPGAISKWLRKKHIPSQNMQDILLKAKELQLDITPDDLVTGRDIPMGDM